MKPNIFQLIDLDRTLFNTSRFAEVVNNIVDRWEPGLGKEIGERFEATYKSEVTFFVLEFIRERFGPEKYAELTKEVAKHFQPEELYLPGAKERITRAEELTSFRPAYGILTMAQSPADQHMKLGLIGLEDVPVLITDTPDKAAVIRSWMTPEGKFQLPFEFGGELVDELTFEDDKIRAFIGLPEHVTGVWITSREDAAERLEETGLQNVHIANDLLESYDLLARNIATRI